MKHTGYGNAAGLLMSHGLLGGGRSQGQDEYSDDSGCSENEEYQYSKGKYVQWNLSIKSMSLIERLSLLWRSEMDQLLHSSPYLSHVPYRGTPLYGGVPI